MLRGRCCIEETHTLFHTHTPTHLEYRGDVGVVHAAGGYVAGEHDESLPVAEHLAHLVAVPLALSGVDLQHLEALVRWMFDGR